MESLEIILSNSDKQFTNEEKVALAEKKNNIYRELLSTLTSNDLVDGSKELISYLKGKNIKVAIGSSSKNTKYILTRLGIIDLFDAISDGNNIKNSKPDPEVFLKAAAYLGLEPVECMVVEDAKAGIDAARNGGFKNFGIGDASTYELTDHPINTLLDIEKII